MLFRFHESRQVLEELMRSTIDPRVSAFVAASLTALLLAATPTRGGDGATAEAIVFGQPAALEGPAAALGTGMRAGINAAFEEANKKGGIHGRKLKLISVDDGYEPDKSIAAVKKLIDEDKVFALIGPVG